MSDSQATPGGFARVQGWWWDVDGFDGDCLAVLVALCKFDLKGDGVVFPSQSTIADLLRKSRSWVNKRIGQLVEIGLITKENFRRTNGGETSCRYRIIYAQPGQETEQPAAVSRSPDGTGGVVPSDSKKKKSNTNTQLGISDWKPQEATLREMRQTGTDREVRRCLDRFRARVEKNGYAYSDFDAGLLTWWNEDRLKLRKRATASRARTNVPVRTPETVETCIPSEISGHVDIVRSGGELPAGISDAVRFQVALVLAGDELSPGAYTAWLQALSYNGLACGQIRIMAPSSFHASHVSTQFADTIMAAARRAGFSADRLNFGCETRGSAL